MATTLTLAGVLLVKMRDRYQHRMESSSGRVGRAAHRWGVVVPYFTAALVLVVGLGLAICREITYAHRGAIWIEDGRIGGASVCVALPVESA